MAEARWLQAGLARFAGDPGLMGHLVRIAADRQVEDAVLMAILEAGAAGARERSRAMVAVSMRRFDWGQALARLRQGFAGARDRAAAEQLGRVLIGLNREALAAAGQADRADARCAEPLGPVRRGGGADRSAGRDRAGRRGLRPARLHAAGGGGAAPPIPRRIHQYWDRPPPPDQVAAMIETWRAAPGFVHDLLDREGALARLRADFGPCWVQAFHRARGPAEEADLLRLGLLVRDGGVYADADDRLRGDLAGLIDRGGGACGLCRALRRGDRQQCHRGPARSSGAAAGGLDGASGAAGRSARIGLAQDRTRAVALYLARAIQTGSAPDLAILSRDAVCRRIAMHNPLPHKRSESHWNSGTRIADATLLAPLLKMPGSPPAA